MVLAEMAHDREHEQALQATAESLLAEQHSLQKKLQQLQLEYETENGSVQKQQAGEATVVCVQRPNIHIH